MSGIEDELRATFARHEALAPPVAPVRARIDLAWVRAKRRRLARRLTGAVAVVLLAGAAAPMAVDQWRDRTPAVPTVEPLAAQPLPPPGPIDVLLLGNDNRLRWDDPRQRHADTVMMIHVPADRSRTYLISLPRDGEVTLPDGSKAKLAETLLHGGPALAERTVAVLTGVDFDARVTLDLRALRAVTAAVGGVEMCLPQSIKVTPTGRKFPKGCQHLTADEIASVLQSRYGLKNGSYDRDRNTQRFLGALAAKLTEDGTLADPARMQALLKAGRDGIELDGGRGALLAVITSLESAEVVGVSEPSFRATPEGRERIYPGVGPGLYAAIRGDTLQTWTRANPLYVTK
ncbi:LCP family protein [Actinoplanes sp. NPDC049599]|uniref:LCP family protein n=1 Tax=Actinoplanes sp. NPDC049599 TaxID=3363903 RepID=UPI003789B8DC